MTRIVVKHLVFDVYNLEHIKKHDVTTNEVEKAGQTIIYHKKTYEGRYLAVGRSGKRLLSLVLQRKDIGTYYLVTARDAGKNERKRVYEKEKKQNSAV